MKYANELPWTPPTQAEQLSALADGELDSAQASALVQACKDDPAVLPTWASYHTIGDVLRAHAQRYDAYGLAQSAGKASPVHTAPASAQQPRAADRPVAQAAANDSVFRWKLLAGVAALAALGSVMWSLVGSQLPPSGAQLAQQSPAVERSATQRSATGTEQAAAAGGAASAAATPEPAPVMIRDPRLDELLAAHKQFGGASALQQPAGFLRNATFQTTGR